MRPDALTGLLAASPIQFATPLGLTAWTVLAGVPLAILALYFLKLRRRPVQVPSTLLWRRSLEDLHVNSLFQRLRKNLLLFLQLLAVLLAMLALLGPRMKGHSSQGQRYILAIDQSASMSATDIQPTRLEQAKKEAGKIIANMQKGDLAMVIAFSDQARVVSSYTANRDLLRARIDAIEPTQAATSLREALQVAAGLANPSKQIGEGEVATSVVPPKLFVFTDGGFADVDGFSLGNLVPEVVVIGAPASIPAEPTSPGSDARKPVPPSNNLAVLGLQAARNEEKPDQFQVFGRVHNYRGVPVSTEAKLLKHDPAKPGGQGTLIDALALKIGPQSDQSFKFDLPDQGAVELEVRLDIKDDLPLDNRAFAVFGNPRKAQVLLVSSGDRYLAGTLKTETAAQLADVTVVTPEQAETDPFLRDAATGRYDLVIYDRVRPKASPEANTLSFGSLPPGKAFDKAKDVEGPVILDWNLAHPLTQYIRDLSLVLIDKAQIVEPPTGSTVLIESNKGPLAFVTPRSGFVDAVVTFPLIAGKSFNTDWPLRLSFPLFIFNSLRALGNAREASGNDAHQPGQPVVLRADSAADSIEVTAPDGTRRTLKRSSQGTFIDNDANQTGVYRGRWGQDGRLTYVVNLFDARESNLAPRGLAPEGLSEAEAEPYKIKIGYTAVAGTQRTAPVVKDWWKPIAALVLGVILLEWYIYNKRVYI